MASSIGEVLDIESPDSYIKRPAGPMVTVEIKDISKLAGIIRIPSIVEGAGPEDTTAQRILYSRLPNQCWKCRKFGHLAKNCPLNRSPMQDGNIPLKVPTEWRRKNDQGRNTSAQRWSIEKPKGPTDQRSKGSIRPHKDRPSKEEGTGRNPYSSGNLQHTASKAIATDGEGEKERKSTPPPPTHTSDSDQKMSDCTISPPHRTTREQKGTVLHPIQDSTPRTRLSFAILELTSSPGSGDLANLNPFAGNSGEASRSGLLQIQQEDPGEGWTFQGKRRLPVRLLSPQQDLAETTTRPPHLVTTPGGKRGQTHLELHHSYFESLGISVPEGQDFCKARIWPVLSREKDEKEQILVHARNQTPPDLPLSIRVTSPPEERWTHTSAQEDLILRLEAELEEKVLRYKLAVRGNLHLEWNWQAEPGRGGMECTILAHIRTGSSALSVQNKRHLHWKEIGSISAMNNDTGAAVVAHNLLLKRDPSNAEHLVHKQKMASILASPQAARKKRFVKLELGSLEDNLPTGNNLFQYPKATRGTSQFGPEPDLGYGELIGVPQSTFTALSTRMLIGGTPPPSIYSEPAQGLYKGSIGQEAALVTRTNI
ncbi:unnamed protein product [Sphagnum jensenii]|uniref:CCHC-type domain-containing protein n=1 Tax=Sphagnum jensenii TaxID=128206 RepID=A0ABP0X6X3_9BRYO